MFRTTKWVKLNSSKGGYEKFVTLRTHLDINFKIAVLNESLKYLTDLHSFSFLILEDSHIRYQQDIFGGSFISEFSKTSILNLVLR